MFTPPTHVVAVCKGANAILQNVPVVVEGIEACFINFDGPQDVVLGLEGTEGVRCGFQCFQDSKKLFMTHLLFYIGFSIPLALV